MTLYQKIKDDTLRSIALNDDLSEGNINFCKLNPYSLGRQGKLARMNINSQWPLSQISKHQFLNYIVCLKKNFG